jgi:hypothetical protein
MLCLLVSEGDPKFGQEMYVNRLLDYAAEDISELVISVETLPLLRCVMVSELSDRPRDSFTRHALICSE